LDTLRYYEIEITAVDRITFRSARLTIENDPHPRTRYGYINHPPPFYGLSFYGIGATTYRAYLCELKPETSYSISAWLGYSGFKPFKIEDYAGRVNFTTLPLPYIGNDTYEDPHSVDGALYHNSFPDYVWLEGYIVGEYNLSSGGNFNPSFNIVDNILIAGDWEEMFRYKFEAYLRICNNLIWCQVRRSKIIAHSSPFRRRSSFFPKACRGFSDRQTR